MPAIQHTLTAGMRRTTNVLCTCFLLAFATCLGSSFGVSAQTVDKTAAWGVAPSATLARNPSSWINPMVYMGARHVRGFDSSSEERLTALLDAGVSVTGILWVPNSLTLDTLDTWQTLVSSLVSKYKGRIQHWEVGNEPPNFLANKSPIFYGAVVAAAYDAAKAVDPTVQIGLSAKSNHINWLAQSIDAGAKNKFDYITLHPYENATALKEGWEGQFLSMVPNVRAMLQEKSPLQANAPVWFTEIGISVDINSPNVDTYYNQADLLVKIYTLSMAQGVERVYWFSPADAEGEYLGLLNSDKTPRPSYHAYKLLATYLGQQPNYKGWFSPAYACCGFVFEGPQGTVLLAWNKPGTSSRMTLPSHVYAFNPRTGQAVRTRSLTLTSNPVLLVTQAGSSIGKQWLKAASANAAKRFSWYTPSTSANGLVQLVAGQAPQGVFMMNPPEPTLFNGTPEFNLMGRSGARFTVNPALMPFNAGSVRISAVLRSLGTGDPGFNLKYESDAPLAQTDGNYLTAAKSGWHRVGNTNYYTATWLIPNPRFVGVYGYHFAFDTDGPSHSQFSVQSVTVSKQTD